MLMKEVLNATDVRREWGKFVDDVVRDKPRVVKRNRDFFLSLSIDHTIALLSEYKFELELLQEEDGSYVSSIKAIDVLSIGETKEEAIHALAYNLIEYAEEYMKEFHLHYQSSNRRLHFPYVLRILIENDIEGVKKLIDA
jgi:hypothetical protein